MISQNGPLPGFPGVGRLLLVRLSAAGTGWLRGSAANTRPTLPGARVWIRSAAARCGRSAPPVVRWRRRPGAGRRRHARVLGFGHVNADFERTASSSRTRSGRLADIVGRLYELLRLLALVGLWRQSGVSQARSSPRRLPKMGRLLGRPFLSSWPVSKKLPHDVLRHASLGSRRPAVGLTQGGCDAYEGPVDRLQGFEHGLESSRGRCGRVDHRLVLHEVNVDYKFVAVGRAVRRLIAGRYCAPIRHGLKILVQIMVVGLPCEPDVTTWGSIVTC